MKTNWADGVSSCELRPLYSHKAQPCTLFKPIRACVTFALYYNMDTIGTTESVLINKKSVLYSAVCGLI